MADEEVVLTKEEKQKVRLLRESVRLQSPDAETDPAYQFTDQQLLDILTLVTPTYNIKYTVGNIPDSEFYFSLLLAKKEIFYRLAASTAPFYPLSAEGATLQKNVRFDHYMALIKAVEESYRVAKEELTTLGVIQSYDVSLPSRYFTLRNYNMSERPQIEITLGLITTTSINLDWTKWDGSKGALFHSYRVYVQKESIIDEYAYYPLKPELNANFYTPDINRLKWRVEKLLPDTDYFAAVVVYDRNGLYGWDEKPFRTFL